MAKVYVFLANGVEEIEALTVVDILRRGGVETVTVSVTGKKEILGSHAIPFGADVLFDEDACLDGDMIVLAGKGHETYQLLNTGRIHFDDREVAREAITEVSSNE